MPFDIALQDNGTNDFDISLSSTSTVTEKSISYMGIMAFSSVGSVSEEVATFID